jgi:uncharacterized protein (TIGR02996 family)
MSEEEGFLQSIQAHPGDAALRLVYADWLEERGDVRGEFIRVQEEMNALPAHSDRHAELKPRRNELREQIDAAWREKLGYVPRHRPLFTHLPERRVERWRLVEEFIDTWYKPLKPGDGVSEEVLRETEERLGFRLPAALREWHALAGKRKEVWSNQDHLLEIQYLNRENSMSSRQDAFIFYVENQTCELWGIRKKDFGLEDPPVYRFLEPARVSPSVSIFAIQVLLYEAKWRGGRIHANASFYGNTGRFREIRRKLRKCALPQSYWCADPVRVYEGEDILVEIRGGDDWMYVVARTEEAYQQLSEALRAQLERYD